MEARHILSLPRETPQEKDKYIRLLRSPLTATTIPTQGNTSAYIILILIAQAAVQALYLLSYCAISHYIHDVSAVQYDHEIE